jgi:hypothetical protein
MKLYLEIDEGKNRQFWQVGKAELHHLVRLSCCKPPLLLDNLKPLKTYQCFERKPFPVRLHGNPVTPP